MCDDKRVGSNSCEEVGDFGTSYSADERLCQQDVIPDEEGVEIPTDFSLKNDLRELLMNGTLAEVSLFLG